MSFHMTIWESDIMYTGIQNGIGIGQTYGVVWRIMFSAYNYC
jgi:hypothetical protein